VLVQHLARRPPGATGWQGLALSELARRWAGGADPLSARELAVRFALPGALLTNVLKDLGKAKLVASTRGVHGGYRLALDPADISVIDVVTAVDGPIRLTACAEGLPIVGQGCDLMRHCPIRRPIVRRSVVPEKTVVNVPVTEHKMVDEEVITRTAVNTPSWSGPRSPT